MLVLHRRNQSPCLQGVSSLQPAPASFQHPRRVHRTSRVKCASVRQKVPLQVDGHSTGVSVATLVVGDIGGTHARLSVLRADLSTKQKVEVYKHIYFTRDYPTFNSVLRVFLKEEEVPNNIDAACLAVAGPVSNNACVMTNLSWIIDGNEVQELFGIQTKVLNDFEALGYGIPVLRPEDLVALNPDATPLPKGPKAVLGPGTALGEAQLMWDDSRNAYKVYPSEGSHADFAPRGALQRELLEFAEEVEGLPAVEVEHVACGAGLRRIYSFFCYKNGTSMKFEEPADISANGLREDGSACPLCSQAVDMFLNIIGAEAGHMALRNLATGGVYIAGGIAPKMIGRIQEGNVYTAFTNQPASRFSKALSQFPLFVVKNDKVGLLGTYEYAMAMVRQQRS